MQTISIKINIVHLVNRLCTRSYLVGENTPTVTRHHNVAVPAKWAQELEEKLRGSTSGYNLPDFVVDLPGGGGKRNIWSYRYYNPDNGISVFRSPVIDENKFYFYFDPLSHDNRELKSGQYNNDYLNDVICKMKQRSFEEMR